MSDVDSDVDSDDGDDDDDTDEYDVDTSDSEFDVFDSDDDTDTTDEEDETDDEEEDDDDTDDDDTDLEDSDDYQDSDTEEEDAEDEDDETALASVDTSDSKRGKVLDDKEYDEPFAITAMQDMGLTLGVMYMCNKLDLTNVKIIKMARFAFIGYVILTQIFLLYIRYQAHKINDRTKITLKNPLSDMLQSQISSATEGDSGTSGMMKNMASSFLASESTILEYDLQQAKTMNSSLLIPMVMLYFLHFRMGQVQPLFFQTATGLKQLFTSPLFQAYCLGKNLERPFVTPSFGGLMEDPADSSTAAEGEEGDKEVEDVDEEKEIEDDEDISTDDDGSDDSDDSDEGEDDYDFEDSTDDSDDYSDDEM